MKLRYGLLGWLAWQFGKRRIQRKLQITRR